MHDTNKLWQNVLGQLELSVSRMHYLMWFRDTYIHKIDEGVVFVGVPSIFIKDWLIKKFQQNILKTLRDLDNQIRAVEFVIKDPSKRKHEEPKTVNAGQMAPQSLPLQEFYINKEDNLNPKYTFETFVVGPFNELAFAAAQAIMKRPGYSYNPFVVYGSTGHGKTHLLQAVGNTIKKNFTDKKVFYMTSERFGTDYFSSLQNNRMQDFKEKYRKYDVLIMDDIQFFSNKERSQEELFHLFNAFHEHNRQIILSSDVHPNLIQNLEDRLKSRFNSGMVVDIQNPDLESRVQILQKKSLLHNIPLNEEIINYLANNIEGNVRELEGVLNSVVCHVQLKNSVPTLNDIKNIIKNNTKPKKNISVKDLIKIVASYYNIGEESIVDKTRKKEVVKPRQVIMYLLREDFNASYPSIGEKLGGRDHTTVIHSCEKIKEEIKTDSVLVDELGEIRSMLGV
jgi:chromosomal replication initiator protein